MLRLRLFYGLLTIVLLLWSVGAAALMLMRGSVREFERGLRRDYRVIDAAQAVRTLTATTNATYLSSLAGPPPETQVDRSIFDKIKQEHSTQIQIITSAKTNDERWRTMTSRMDLAFSNYYNGYEQLFSGKAISRNERKELLRSILTQTQRLTDLAETIMTLGEERLFSSATKLDKDSAKDTITVITFVLLGTTIAALIYFQLVRHLVDPVSSLHRSIEEISKGNFEMILPDPDRGSEFSHVVAAFNQMAAELKTRRGESESNLSRANLINAAILQAIPSPVFVLGDDSDVIQINPAAEKLTESLGLLGRLPLKIQRILDDCRMDSTNFMPEDPREALLFRIDEQEYFYLPRIFRFDSDSSGQTGWAILLHNVSRIRWLDDMKTNLISTVSHEIKTPLTGIRMVLHLLLEERSSKLDEMQKIMVTSANEDCERLLVTLNTLLDLSRAESGATQLECVPMRLEDSVQRAISLHTPAARNLGIELELESPEQTLPEILADPIRLDEVINNLVSNAIKYGPDHSKIVLKISRPEPEYLRFSVIDAGAGVPEESHSRIFERFYRAPDQPAEGVGLGLFISREIMRAHEGRIGLSERDDQLTEFYIDVPIA